MEFHKNEEVIITDGDYKDRKGRIVSDGHSIGDEFAVKVNMGGGKHVRSSISGRFLSPAGKKAAKC
jgi:hypothetical protein